jgi:nitrite reductase/ring-hydroxylating ferredoxin subunit
MIDMVDFSPLVPWKIAIYPSHMSEPTETSPQHVPSTTGRRNVLRGAAALAGLAAVAPLTAGTAQAAETRPVGAEKKPKAGGMTLGPVSDVPVGKGKIYDDQKVVVTQPKKGQYHAFSAVCTHQSCILADCDGGKINCGCHASSFDFTTGVPEGGPATVPLPKKKVKVVGGKFVVS